MNCEDYLGTQSPTEIASNCKSYLIETEDMVIHIIKTGFSESRRYMVVYEDAYKQLLGKTEILSSKEIEKRYKIYL